MCNHFYWLWSERQQKNDNLHTTGAYLIFNNISWWAKASKRLKMAKDQLFLEVHRYSLGAVGISDGISESRCIIHKNIFNSVSGPASQYKWRTGHTVWLLFHCLHSALTERKLDPSSYIWAAAAIIKTRWRWRNPIRAKWDPCGPTFSLYTLLFCRRWTTDWVNSFFQHVQGIKENACSPSSCFMSLVLSCCRCSKF